jgi:hypothetical protein
MDSLDCIVYDDTILSYYVSGKFGLPIDVNFNDNIPIVFESKGNTSNTWQILYQQGIGQDSVVKPQFGDGMLVFTGFPGSMTTLATHQLDLSLTKQPSLSFWYFHDTIPAEDYTDVYITVDGGTTYNTLYSLTKYNATYGWKQYSMDLPSYAVNQCVILVFEAMEKSRSGDVTQYIDRIRITAKQDIAVTEILTSEYNICDLENKELKVVLSNLTDPVLDYTTTPIIVTLEIKETGQTFTRTLTSGALGRFASDTITVTDFDLAKGTYNFKAYFTSVLDVDRDNDTLVTSLIINPELNVELNPISGNNTCLSGELPIYQEVILTNTGNMDLYNIELVLQIDTGETGSPAYAILTETCTDTIHAGNTYTYSFKNAYKAPWKSDFYPRIFAYLSCDSNLTNTTIAITECVDAKDLYIVSIDNPLLSSIDKVGSSVQVNTTIGNRSDLSPFAGLNITVLIENSQGIEMERFTEQTGTIGMSATASHNFSRSYTVPNDTAYSLSVFLDHYDEYLSNDTLKIRRTTDYTGINTIAINAFALGQNIPNPATNSTRIDYSVPDAGEVVFHVHNITGQLLYSKTIEAARGTNSIKLNTSTFAAGVYFYSMEYKGQRRVKQLIINN